MSVRMRRWLRRAALTGVVVVVGLLVAAQIVLPIVAADHVRSELRPYGRVLAVSVSAFPAVELLWGRAGSVTIHMASFQAEPAPAAATATSATAAPATASSAAAAPATASSTTGRATPTIREAGLTFRVPSQTVSAQIASVLTETRQTGSLALTIDTLQAGPLTVRDVVLTKRAGQFVGRATLTRADLRAALPSPFVAAPENSAPGHLDVEAGVSVLGFRVVLTARLQALHGRLELVPTIAHTAVDLVKLVVFADPRVDVEAVRAQGTRDGWTLSAEARLTGRR